MLGLTQIPVASAGHGAAEATGLTQAHGVVLALAGVYWVFVNSASPLSTLFIVASIVLFTGSLVYSVEAARRPDQSASIVPAD